MVKAKRSDFDEISNEKISKCIDNYIKREIDRKALKMRLIDGCTIDEISYEISLSTNQTKTIIYRGQEKILKFILR